MDVVALVVFFVGSIYGRLKGGFFWYVESVSSIYAGCIQLYLLCIAISNKPNH